MTDAAPAAVPAPADTIHATTVAIDGRGVLLLGASGAGKSDLALRLIDRGAALVADDRTRLVRDGARLLACPPARIAGKMEVRGIGIVAMAHVDAAAVALAVTLAAEDERMPERRTTDLAGVVVPTVTIDPRFPSAPIKVELALGQVPS